MTTKRYIMSVAFNSGEKEDAMLCAIDARGTVVVGVTPAGELYVQRECTSRGRADGTKKVIQKMQEAQDETIIR